jgi:SAM-dependent methyltransferase
MKNGINKWHKDSKLKINKSKISEWIDQESDPVYVEYDNDKNSKLSSTFPASPDDQLPFLQYISKIKDAKVLEFGCSNGRMVWKILLAGGKVFANDLQKNQVEKVKNLIKDRLPHKIADLETDYGNALTILERHPQIKESFDAIYSQNLIHYFDPEQVNKFCAILYDSLKPGGKVHLTGAHIYGIVSNLYNYYLTNKIEKEIVRSSLKEEFIPNIISIYEETGYYYLKPDDKYGFIKPLPNDRIDHGLIHNSFTNEILKKALEANNFQIVSLICLDTFGIESKCYDNISVINFEDRYENIIFNSQQVHIVAMKPLGNDPQQHDEL